MSASDPDIYSLATLGSLLGGGGSFSAGGPGKGMYTRLYTQVLNRSGWFENCNVFNHTYKDSSLFGISGSVPTDIRAHQHLVPTICEQILLCTQSCETEELNRAKNQLKSNLLMSLESKTVEVEDIGRQLIAHGKRLNAEETCSRIDLVEIEDVVRVGRRVFTGENLPSRFKFDDGICKPWTPTGPCNPSVLIEGDLKGRRDPLRNVESTMRNWGLLPPKSWL
jgi:processing peptidase subunit alpha